MLFRTRIFGALVFIGTTASAVEFETNFTEDKTLMFAGQTTHSIITSNTRKFEAQAFRGYVDYFTTRKLAMSVGYFSMLNPNGVTIASGLEAGVKWFVFSPGSAIKIRNSRLNMFSYSNWSHYLLLSYRQKDFILSSTKTPYSGIAYGYGLNWYAGRQLHIPMSNQIFINGEISNENLSSASTEELAILSYAIGAGAVF